MTQSLKYVLVCFLHHRLSFLPDSAASSPENKWIVIVDRASLLLVHALSGLYKVQEQSWRLLELHSLKIVSSGIIWVSLQEVELFSLSYSFLISSSVGLPPVAETEV